MLIKKKKILKCYIYISKILLEYEDGIEDVKIHNYDVYLYGEDVNKKYWWNFKKYYERDFDITQEEIEEIFIEIYKEKNIRNCLLI